MPIRVLRGLPGSGKSMRLIEVVTAAAEEGRSVATFMCRESPRLWKLEYLRVHRLLGCRRPEIYCPLTHLVSTDECGGLLTDLSPGTLLAFDEAHWFGPEVASFWLAASERGHEVVVAQPSSAQLKLLAGHEYVETTLRMTCQRCGDAPATTYVKVSLADETRSLCADCRDELAEAARREIVERLARQTPSPGEQVIEQPVELEECESWTVLRRDSSARAKLITSILDAVGLVGGDKPRGRTYLDVGCGTGYFCHHVRRLGFYPVEGIDTRADSLLVAKLLDSVVRRDHNQYAVANCRSYLEDGRERPFDVTSAFDWVPGRGSDEDGAADLEALFRRTGRVCFLGSGALPSASLRKIMEERGGFARVWTVDARVEGLAGDLVVGLKPPAAAEWVRRIEARFAYPSLVRRLRDLAASVLPDDAHVIVVSRGDDELVSLGGWRGLHFPQTEDGAYAGHYPANSDEAIAQLEALRAKRVPRLPEYGPLVARPLRRAQAAPGAELSRARPRRADLCHLRPSMTRGPLGRPGNSRRSTSTPSRSSPACSRPVELA